MIRGLIQRNWIAPTGFTIWVLMLVWAEVASAQQPVEPAGPREVVAQATDRIMALVREAPDYFEDDPDRYINGVGEELDRVVDFRGFARGVMGSYASAERYRSLDKTEQQRLREQLDKFTDVLRVGMVSTYSRGLLAFGGYGVELGDTDFSPNSSRVASVTQLVSGEDGKVYTVKYQMGQYRDGSWKLRNLIIENINMGEIYRGQFEAAAEEAGGDLDIVIANWDDSRIQSEAREEYRGGE